MRGFLLGGAIGYVLGSRAGRERYEQIERMCRQVIDHPAVQAWPAWSAPRSARCAAKTPRKADNGHRRTRRISYPACATAKTRRKGNQVTPSAPAG